MNSTLAGWVETYFLQREGCDLYRRYVLGTVQSFGRFLGRQAELTDLSDDNVNRWLLAIADGRSRETVRGYRRRILALWRAAWEAELVDQPPRRIRKIAAAKTLPEAWSLQQLGQLLAAAEQLTGRFSRTSLQISRAAFFRAFILASHDSGLRLGDVERLRFDQIGSDGSVVVVQQKTGEPILCKLRPETVAAIEAIAEPRRALVFGGVIGRRTHYQIFRELVRRAGIRGSTRWLRRSSGTFVELLAPGRGHEQTGHRDRATFLRHYFDQRQREDDRPRPPRIA